MEQHAIPQQISSYQFRLVGDMTLKQFAELAAGALVALLIYATPLPPIIKWPLIIIFALFGAALAFLPFEERPLERWIFAFFRSIYTPTVFNWQKITTPPAFFQAEPVASPQAAVNPTQTEPILNAYLASTANKAPTQSKLDAGEAGFLSKISELMQAPAGAAAPKTNQKPPITSTAKPMLVTPEPSFIPEGVRPKIVVEEKSNPLPQVKFTPVSETSLATPAVGQAAKFSPEAAPPNPPTTPNVVVGQITDTAGKIIEGVIMEIRDTRGRPVRALRSNKLGHFMIVTPLTNGRYEIVSEKDGFTFTPLSFDANGTIIQPIMVQGKPEKN